MGTGIVKISKTLLAEFLQMKFSDERYASDAPEDLRVIAVRECALFHPDIFEAVVETEACTTPREFEVPEELHIKITKDPSKTPLKTWLDEKP